MTKLSKAVNKIKTDDIILKVRRLVAEAQLTPTQMITLSRIELQSLVTMEAVELIRAVLDIATLEEPIQEIPADWFQHWKQRWLPRWLKRRFPVRTSWVWAIHKYPELAVPPMGRECLHLQVVDADRLMKELEGEPKE